MYALQWSYLDAFFLLLIVTKPPSHRRPPWDIQHNIPRFYNGTSLKGRISGEYALKRKAGGDWVAEFFTFFGDNLLDNWIGIRHSNIRAFFTGWQGIL